MAMLNNQRVSSLSPLFHRHEIPARNLPWCGYPVIHGDLSQHPTNLRQQLYGSQAGGRMKHGHGDGPKPMEITIFGGINIH